MRANRFFPALVALLIGFSISRTAIAHPANQEACSAFLAGYDFTRLIDKALSAQVLKLADAEALARASAPYNPLQNRTVSPAAVAYSEAFARLLPSAREPWPAIRAELNKLLDAKNENRDEGESTRLDTSGLFGLEPVRIHAKTHRNGMLYEMRELFRDQRGSLWLSMLDWNSGLNGAVELKTGKKWWFPKMPKHLQGASWTRRWVGRPGEAPELRLFYDLQDGTGFEMYTARLHDQAWTVRKLAKPAGAMFSQNAPWLTNPDLLELNIGERFALYDTRLEKTVSPLSDLSFSNQRLLERNGEPDELVTALKDVAKATTTFEWFENTGVAWKSTARQVVPVPATGPGVAIARDRHLMSLWSLSKDSYAFSNWVDSSPPTHQSEYPDRKISELSFYHSEREGMLSVTVASYGQNYEISVHKADFEGLKFYGHDITMPHHHLSTTSLDWLELNSGEPILTFLRQGRLTAISPQTGLNYIPEEFARDEWIELRYHRIGDDTYLSAYGTDGAPIVLKVHGLRPKTP